MSSGTNPYLPDPNAPKPTRAYKVTFLPMNVTVDVDPAKIPYDDHGLEGSLLEIALGHKVNIDHACGGVVACSTCHVYVKQGLDTCNEAQEAELDRVDEAPNPRFHSRLACQTVPNGTKDVIVEVPKWNRNNVREGA